MFSHLPTILSPAAPVNKVQRRRQRTRLESLHLPSTRALLLEKHLQAENGRKAAAEAAALKRGVPTEASCPMLARYLKTERACGPAMDRSQDKMLQVEESAGFDIPALAAKIRSTPREERRALLQALP